MTSKGPILFVTQTRPKNGQTRPASASVSLRQTVPRRTQFARRIDRQTQPRRPHHHLLLLCPSHPSTRTHPEAANGKINQRRLLARIANPKPPNPPTSSRSRSRRRRRRRRHGARRPVPPSAGLAAGRRHRPTAPPGGTVQRPLLPDESGARAVAALARMSPCDARGRGSVRGAGGIGRSLAECSGLGLGDLFCFGGRFGLGLSRLVKFVFGAWRCSC